MAETAKKGFGISTTTQIVIATIGGIVFGSLVGPWASNLKFIGDIFIRLIQMSVVLLVMTSVASSISNLGGKGLGRMGFNTFKWFIIFTIFAAAVGIVVGYIIQPGLGISLVDAEAITSEVQVAPFQETLLGFVSTNIIASMADGTMVPCILFSLFFGIAAGQYTRQTGNDNIIEWIIGFNAVILNIIKIVMKIAPIGIFCLLAHVAGGIGFKVIIPMVKFLGAMTIADLIIFAVIIPLTGFLCKVNPMKMPGKLAKMSVMALTTTSSAICLPTQMEDSVTKFGISKRVSDFVAPLAMSMNSAGAALHHVLAIIFMSQASGIDLTLSQLVILTALSCLLCMGTIVVPGGMIVTKTFLAVTLGLPLESLALLVGIDWFAGMLRTILNVDSDVLAAMLVASKEGELDRDVYNEKKVVGHL